MNLIDIFRRLTPERIARSELMQARIDLIEAERNLDKANSSVAYLQQRITRLTEQADVNTPNLANTSTKTLEVVCD